MTKFTATFADGTTITRGSEHEYVAAWRATWTEDDGVQKSATGFTKNASKPNALRPSTVWIHRRMSSAMKAEAKRKNEAFLVRSGYRVEIVPVKAED